MKKKRESAKQSNPLLQKGHLTLDLAALIEHVRPASQKQTHVDARTNEATCVSHPRSTVKFTVARLDYVDRAMFEEITAKFRGVVTRIN